MSDQNERDMGKGQFHLTDSRNSALLEFCTEGIAILDKQGYFVYVTPSVNKLLDYTPEQIEKMRLYDLVHSSDVAAVEKSFNTVANNSGAAEIEGFRMLSKDGKFSWFEASLVNKIDDSAIAGIVFNFRIYGEPDTSNEGLAIVEEQNLPEIESFNDSVFAALNDQIAVVSEHGTILAVNKSWQEFAGDVGEVKTLNSAVGSNYFSVCQAAIADGDYDVKRIMDGILSVFTKKASSFHQEYPCRMPTFQKWFLINVLPLGEDGTKVVITHQEITKRKLAEDNLSLTAEKLKNTLSKLSSILNSSLDIICTVNSNMEFATVNNAVFDILGYRPEELIGTKFINLVYEEDIDRTIEAAAKIFKGFPLQLFENRYLHKSGKVVPLLWSVNWDEKAGRMYGVAKDVTERNNVDKAIESERDQFYEMFSKAPSAIGMLRGADHIFEMANPLYLQMIGKTDVIGKRVVDVLPEVVEQGFIRMLDYVYTSGKPYIDREQLVKVYSEDKKKFIDFYINFVYQAYRDQKGKIEGVFFFINDITEQVTAKRKISKSEKFFKGVIENSQDMVATISTTGSVLYASPAVSKKYGFTAEEILKLNIAEVIHPNDRQLSIDFITEVLRQPGLPLSCPAIRQRKKDETYIWVEATLTNFLETDGINAIVVNFRDISERKKAEFVLRETLAELEMERTRLLTAQKVAKIGSWETNAITLEAIWSDETFHIFGADPKYFKASYEAFLAFIHPDDAEAVATNFKATLSGKGTNWIEHRIITLQGVTKWVEERWTVSEDENGAATVAIGTCQDITSRKEAEEKVLKSEIKLKIAQHIAHVGSWEFDIQRNEHTWSDEFYSILEISQNVIPSTNSLLVVIHPDDRDMVRTSMSKGKLKKVDSSFFFRFLRKNGETGYASTEWKTKRDINGNTVQIYGILRDLTQEKKAEDDRQKMVIDIIQRNKDLEQFSYIISHNLRSPVANIIGLTEELRDYTHSAETVVMLREAISSDVKRLEEIIVDLNNIVQTKRDIFEQKEEVAFSELVENITLSINYLIKNQGIYITTDFAAVRKIRTIKSYMQSIFYNLISNSIKYRRKDCDLLIDIRTTKIQKGFIIVFKDNGIGIDIEKNSSHLFGLYKRFHTGTEGKGLGLYMVKTQVETLGGKISIESKLNVGTTFTIEFQDF